MTSAGVDGRRSIAAGSFHEIIDRHAAVDLDEDEVADEVVEYRRATS